MRIKLIGMDLIITQCLLKNKGPLDVYLLFTEEWNNQHKNEIIDRNFGWGEHKEHVTEYDHMGEINYCYKGLKPLFESIYLPYPFRTIRHKWLIFWYSRECVKIFVNELSSPLASD